MALVCVGMTSCALCAKMVSAEDSLICLSPCLPGWLVDKAFGKVSPSFIAEFDWVAWKEEELQFWVTMCNWCPPGVDKEDELYNIPRAIQAVETAEQAVRLRINFLIDSAMHRSCYETSPLREAIDVLLTLGGSRVVIG